ncbi:MAG: thiol reductant ABC exporter subunit CydC [Actinobacteria bacterium]|nr:thiol reductant ABC exporter subunit CydC [Actinomycetota bacterium]MCB9411580.1 thiol reductant ABC exporter subunit CydC [Actinomycetota bacterium]
MTTSKQSEAPTPGAEQDPSEGAIRRLMRLSRPVSGRLVLAAILGALAVGSSVGLLATSAWLISRASEQPPVLFLTIAVVSVRAFGIGRAVFRYAERLVSHDAAFRTLTDMRVSIYSRLADNGPVALRPYRRGDLLSRLVADVDSVQDLSLRVLVPGLAGFIVAAGSVALAVWLLPAAGAILAVALIVGGVAVPWLTMRTGAASAARLAPVQGRMTSEVVDLFSGAADVMSCGAGRRMVARIEATDDEFTRVQSEGAAAAGLAAALGAAAQGAAVVGAVLVAVPAVRSGDLSGVNLAVVVLLPLAAYEAVVNLPTAALALLRVRSSAERVFEVIDTPPAVTETSAPKPLPAPADGVRRVELRDVAAHYPGADRDAVSGVDLTLRTGSTTALVGPSGAGKSTIASVLERFLDYDGRVTLDGTELAELDSDQVRTVIGLCAQDAHVFDTTIGENVRLANRSADDVAVLAALDAARLGDWVAAQPDGLDAAVGMHGAALSGGQRQRLALARALIADFDVLVLDEPTEHLDAETAAALMADLRAATAGKAVLLITHRPADAASADRIVEVGR